MNVKNVLAAAVFSAVSSMSVAASGNFTVEAYANSTSGGTGVATFSLLAGQQFSVTVAANDLWNAGDLPRWSNADGLTGGDLLYTLVTDSQVPVYSVGTVIGSNIFGVYTQNGLTSSFGSLVGQIDNGSFFQIGTNYAGTASSFGTLKLYYFDSNFEDNTGSISAHVTAVPEPETFAMLLAGLGLVAGIARKRKPG